MSLHKPSLQTLFIVMKENVIVYNRKTDCLNLNLQARLCIIEKSTKRLNSHPFIPRSA